MSVGRVRVSGEQAKRGLNMHNNYIHIASMTVGELWAYAVALGVMPSELLDGPFWIRRAPSARED